MSDSAQRRMTSDEFIAWAMQQPETEHYELPGGEVVAMASEQSAQAVTKSRAAALDPPGMTLTGCFLPGVP